ncbi:MAG: FmdB family transcriptional regulator [Chloroflexota bacterium]|nr:FmdB family transcriptional regulator [Chloroflexota bacterium]
MPTYDYECRSCGNRIEVIHSMTDAGPAACERCGGPMRRLLYPAGIIFKGSGFYKTDSRSESGTTPEPSAPPSTDAPAPSASAPPASSAGATKPEA